MLAYKRRARLQVEGLEDRTAPAVLSVLSGVEPGAAHAAAVTAGAPAQLAILAAPTSVATNNPFGLSVAVEDDSGVVVGGYTGSVTLTLQGNPGNAALNGNLTANVVNGVATFTGLSLTAPGIGYTLQAVSNNLSATTNPFNVDTATQLVITTSPPSSPTAGSPFGLTVAVQDGSSNVVASYNGPVTLSLANGPANAQLQGAASVNAVNGIATFSGLSLNTTGGYTLQAAATGLTTTSDLLTVEPAGPAQLTISAPPPPSVQAGSTFGLTVQIQDAFNNVDTLYEGPVSLSLASNPGQSFASVNAVDGVATFSGLSLNLVGAYTLQASVGGTSVDTSSVTVTPGAPAQLVVTTAPPSSVTTDSPFGLAVSVEDGSGNVVTSYSGSVTLAVGTNPGNAMLGGNVSANVVNGVATFTGLTLNAPGVGYTLTASSNGLTGAAGAFNATVDTPTQFVATTTPPSNLTAGASFGLTIAVEDSSGNVVTSYNGPVTLSLASNPWNASLQGNGSVDAVNGVAAFSGLSIGKAGGAYTLQASAGSLTATVSSLTVVPGAPAQLAITAPPPASLSAGTPFGLTVAVEDGSGNVVTGYNGQVSLSLASGPGKAVLQGAAGANAVNGVATFSGLSLDTAGGYTLQVKADGFTATTGILTVAPAGPAQLVITTPPPASIAAGSSFGLTVEVEDTFGSLDTPYNGPVSLSLSANPGKATLQGNVPVNAVNGVATFSGLSIDTANSGYTLQARLGSATATTGGITITPGAPAKLAITTPPPASVAAGSPFGLTLQIQDSFGNVVGTNNGAVALSLSTNPGKATLQGNLTATAKAGVATFSGLSINTPASGYILKATLGALSTTTGSLTVTSTAPAQLAITTAPPSSVVAGSAFGLTVAVKDASGNVLTTYNGPVTLSLSNNPGKAMLQGNLTATAKAGVATFTGLSLTTADAGYVIEANVGKVSTTTGRITVTPASVAQLAITTEPPASLAASGAFGLTVLAEDVFGNVVGGYTGPITVSLASNPGKATLQGKTTVNAVGGVGTFAGLSLNASGVGYTLQANTGGAQNAIPSGSPKQSSYLYTIGVFVQNKSVQSVNYTVVAPNDQEAAQAVNAYLSILGPILSGEGVKWNALTPSLVSKNPVVSSTPAILATTTRFTVVTATHLAITSQPPGNIVVGSPFGLTVKVEDASGKTVSAFSGNVTLTLGDNPGGSTLGGVLTVKAVNGVATFTGLTLNKVGVGYTLIAGSANQPRSATNAFNAVPDLVVTSEPPANVTAGNSFGLTVEVEDGAGHQLTGYNGPVTVALPGNNSNALQGNLTVTAHKGLASFTGLSITKTASNYTLLITAGTWLTSAATSSITVAPGKATHLAVLTQPVSSVAAGGSFGLTVAAEDAFNNVVGGYSGTIALTLSSDPGHTALKGNLSMTAHAGMATFTGLTLDQAANGYRLKAAAGNLATAVTNGVTVTPGAPAELVVTPQAPFSVGSGSPFSLSVAIDDAFLNTVAAYAGKVTLSLPGAPANTKFQGVLTVAAHDGVANFTGLSINTTAAVVGMNIASGSLSTKASVTVVQPTPQSQGGHLTIDA